MKTKKKRSRNPIARALYTTESGFRSGSSTHKNKKVYSRKKKHRYDSQ